MSVGVDTANSRHLGLLVFGIAPVVQVTGTGESAQNLVAQIKQQVLIEPHREFERRYGGKVFVVITLGKKRQFKIVDEDELIERIRNEVERLKALPPGPFG